MHTSADIRDGDNSLAAGSLSHLDAASTRPHRQDSFGRRPHKGQMISFQWASGAASQSG